LFKSNSKYFDSSKTKQFDLQTGHEETESSKNIQLEEVTPFESLIFLSKNLIKSILVSFWFINFNVCLIDKVSKIYQIPAFVSICLFSVRHWVQNLFQRYTKRVIAEKLEKITSPKSIEIYIHKLKEAIFDNKPNDPNETLESVHLKAVQAVNEFINDLSLFHSINKSNLEIVINFNT
jgi:hypothetical protein